MKIKSLTDVITNSSSEVFIIKKELIPEWTEKGKNSNCIDVCPITLDTFCWNKEALCDLMNWNYRETGAIPVDGYYGHYWEWDETVWYEYIKKHHNEIEEKIKDLYWVDIEDHYDWDSYEIDVDNARDVSIWYDYRH